MKLFSSVGKMLHVRCAVMMCWSDVVLYGRLTIA